MFYGVFVYIIQSAIDRSYYKGFSENPVVRLSQHNNGESLYTSNKMPWQLVYVEALPTQKEALIREKTLKKIQPVQILKLIESSQNIISSLYNSVGYNAALSRLKTLYLSSEIYSLHTEYLYYGLVLASLHGQE